MNKVRLRCKVLLPPKHQMRKGVEMYRLSVAVPVEWPVSILDMHQNGTISLRASDLVAAQIGLQRVRQKTA